MFQIIIDLSSPPVINIDPFGENANAFTREVCLFKVLIKLKSVQFQTFIVLSKLTEINIEPLGEISIFFTESV